MTKAVATLLPLFGFAGCAKACATLGEQLAHDEPVIKSRLSTLKPGERIAGIRLCDNSTMFSGWRFIRPARVQGPFQHVLLIRDGHNIRAAAWVESRGREIPVPACPYGQRCTNLPAAATVASGDVYTCDTVKANGELVINWYPPAGW